MFGSSSRIHKRLFLAGVILLCFFWGFLSFSPPRHAPPPARGPVFSSGWQPKSFFDLAYEQKEPLPEGEDIPQSAVVAHHLLVASHIAEVVERFRKNPPSTIVLLSPNHFSAGRSAMQISFGAWETPYGRVATDVSRAKELLEQVPGLAHEEETFVKEHGIAAITPFLARSLPQTPMVALVLDESADPAALAQLGEAIANMPGAVLIASVDMAHYKGEEETAKIDRDVLRRLETNGTCSDRACTERLDIDSNASLTVLAAFNAVRGSTTFHLLSHTSSLGLGATADPTQNTSHLQGFYSTP